MRRAATALSRVGRSAVYAVRNISFVWRFIARKKRYGPLAARFLRKGACAMEKVEAVEFEPVGAIVSVL